MRVFVTGVAGQLGHDVVEELRSRGVETIGSDLLPECDSEASYVSLDITDEKAVQQTAQPEQAPVEPAMLAAIAGAVAASQSGPDVQAGIPAEVVAAIAGAIACMGAPEGVKVYNPAFDVTDHSLITGIITERGICTAPFEDAFRALGF